MRASHDNPVSSDLKALLAVAAEMRAGGSGWEVIAARVQRSVETVRRWPARHAAEWKRVFREAEERFAVEAGAEGMLVLRQMLRSEDEKVRRDVARSLLNARLSVRRLERKTPAAGEAADDRERIAAFLAGRDDAELQQLLEELLAHHKLTEAARP